MSLREFVKQRRLRLGLEQTDIAERMGNRRPNWVSQLENGKISGLPKPDVLERLAVALECSGDDLLRAYGYQVGEPRSPAIYTKPTDEARDRIREIHDLPVNVQRAIFAALDLVDDMERREHNGNG